MAADTRKPNAIVGRPLKSTHKGTTPTKTSASRSKAKANTRMQQIVTYAEVKAIASGNPLVIEKAHIDAELIRLTRLRSAHAEEQYRIRTNLRRSHEDAEMFTVR